MQGLPSLVFFLLYVCMCVFIHCAQKIEISKIFYVFKGVSSAHQGCIYSIKNTEKTVIL